MKNSVERGVKEGIAFGVIAGVILGVMQVIGAAVMGKPPLTPLRMFASIVLGNRAMTQMSLGAVVPIGIVVHLALSAIFGLVYGAINGNFSTKTETNYGRQAGLGLAFGAILWFVNFQIIGRVAYPWVLETPQFFQLVLHTVFFGLPLGEMYATGERHAHPVLKHVLT